MIGAKLYSTAPEIAIPSTIPTLRIAAIIPEAIPRCHGGTLPIISLLFGLWNMPNPVPMITRRHTTSHTLSEAFKPLMR